MSICWHCKCACPQLNKSFTLFTTKSKIISEFKKIDIAEWEFFHTFRRYLGCCWATNSLETRDAVPLTVTYSIIHHINILIFLARGWGGGGPRELVKYETKVPDV